MLELESYPNRIVFVIDALTIGGAQKNLFLLLPELSRRGFDVDLVLLQDSAIELDFNELQSSGIRLTRIRASNMRDLRAFLRLYKVASENNTIVIANLYWSQIWTSLASLFSSKFRVIWIEHNTYIRRTKAQWWLFKRLSMSADLILAVSREILAFISSRSANRIELINNTAVSYFQRDERNLDQPKFIFVGRLIEQKNPVLALRSFAQALNGGLIPACTTLTFIGSGNLEADLKKLSEELLLVDQVQFMGQLESSEISKIMASSHVLIMTSEYEGSPLVRLEALAHGMAIVTTKTAGIEGILTRDGTNQLLPGILVSNASSPSIAEALKSAMHPNCWTLESINIRLKKSTEFSPKNVVDDLVKKIGIRSP
jgi:glycosyltransferase involved in cell wall biosynthesis